MALTTLWLPSQTALSCQDFDWSYHQCLINIGTLTRYGHQPEFHQQGFLSAELEPHNQVYQIAALKTANHKVLSIQIIVSLLIHICYLCVRSWSGIVKNITVEVWLWASFIDWSLRSILSIEHKIVPWHLMQMAIISTKTGTSSITDNNTLFNMNTTW